MQKKTKTLFLTVLLSLGIHFSVTADALSDWALPEYEKAANAGIITYNVVSKNLKEAITREEFCELSVALFNKLSNKTPVLNSENPFTDTNNPAVIKAYQYGLVSGTTANQFDPNRFVTRQEMAKILENIFKATGIATDSEDGASKLPLFNDCNAISEWAIPAVSTVTRYSVMSGSEGNFNPNGNATREQAILSTYRAYEKFADDNSKYLLKCSAPTNGQQITEAIQRVTCNSISKATKYYIIIKDANSNTVKTMTVPSASAFVINKTTVPYGENYTLTVGASISDGTEVFTTPIEFSFIEPPQKEITVADNPLFEEPKHDTKQDEGSKKNELTEENVTQTEPVKETQEYQIPEDMEIGFDDEVMSDKAKALIEEAEKYIGIPYLYGGTTPDGFDCSGYVKYVFEKFGITLKRVSRDQYASCGTEVKRKDLQPGDLVFFGTDGSVSHVGIYTGEGMMIHSPTTGKSICYTSIESNYYLKTYIGAKRVF